MVHRNFEMKTKILIILIILISFGAGGFFVWKNISVPEIEEKEVEKEEALPVVEEKVKVPVEEKKVETPAPETFEEVEKPIEEAEEIKESEGPVEIYNQNISGEIKQNQIWSRTIHVTGDIEVEEGVTLTILPGTIVEVTAFSDDQHSGIDHPHDPPFPKDPDRIETQSTKISVWGTLNAVGTPDNRILFTSDKKETTYDWDGLHISHGRLEYAIIEYARYNNFQEFSDVVVANNIFRNILECCICIGHSKPISPQILYNDIYNCGHEGIDSAGGSPLIKGNYFHRENPEIQPDPSMGGVGIVVYKNAYPIIEDNVFEKNSNAIIFIGAFMHEEEQGKEVIIRNNIIKNNDVGINIDPDYPFDAVIMENNQLINNKEDEAHTG